MGCGRKPGETRLDLTNENVKIMKSVIESVQKYYTRGVVVIISNFVDALAFKASEWMELPSGMVFGSGCILDSSRFVRCVVDYVELSTGVINGYVVGEYRCGTERPERRRTRGFETENQGEMGSGRVQGLFRRS